MPKLSGDYKSIGASKFKTKRAIQHFRKLIAKISLTRNIEDSLVDGFLY
jgi:hypothetical protein